VGDIETMAARAIDILTNEQLARDMGARGRKHAETHFARDPIVSQYEKLYSELLGGQ
jgi:glycosyltransferase involved in cell wall biosynthesis